MKQVAAKHCSKIYSFLPVQRGNVRIPYIIFINALPYVMENGCKWCALQKCFGLGSTSVKVHPDGTGAWKTSGPQSIGKSRGGWYANIHMVSASDRPAMVFRLSCWKAGTSRSRTRLWRWTASAKATRPAASWRPWG